MDLFPLDAFFGHCRSTRMTSHCISSKQSSAWSMACLVLCVCVCVRVREREREGGEGMMGSDGDQSIAEGRRWTEREEEEQRGATFQIPPS